MKLLKLLKLRIKKMADNSEINQEDLLDEVEDSKGSKSLLYRILTSSYLQKFNSGFVIVFCFLFFPIYLLHTSLDIFFESKTENFKQENIVKMQGALEYLEKYSSNKRYFHFLLSRISELAQKNDNPTVFLKANIENIKQKYPGKLEFIVWDKNGNILQELSDRSGYSYVLNKIYVALHDVSEQVKGNSNASVLKIESVSKNLNIIKNFLGRIFVPENLKIPLLDSSEAGPFVTELGRELSFVWFSMGKEISFMCFLADDLMRDFQGLKKIAETLNKNQSDFITGFSVSPDFEKPIPNIPDAYYSDILLALSTFKSAGDNVFENENSIVLMAMPQPSIRTFCYLHKDGDIWNYKYKRDLWFYILTSILLAIYAALAVWFLYKKHFFSIRWKLTALFLFVNLAPLCVLAFIANGYLASTRQALKNEIVSELEKRLRDFDEKYNFLREEYGNRLNEKTDPIVKALGGNTIDNSIIEKLRNIAKEFEGSEYYLVASSGAVVDFYRNNVLINQKADFMASYASAILQFANGTQKYGSSDMFSSMLNAEDSEFVRFGVRNSRRVYELLVADNAKICYSCFLGDFENYKNNYYFMIVWDRNDFQNIFLKKSYKELVGKFPEATFYVRSNDGKNVFGPNKFPEEINTVLNKNLGMSEKVNGLIDIAGQNNVFVGLNGKLLKNWILLATYSADNIERKINLIIFRIITGAFLSLFLTIVIGHILSLQFLKPIHNLGEAAVAIGERNFTYRLPIGDHDEFGHLNQVFNRAIEGLGDLEVAKIVQESLFPGNHFSIGDYDIFGRSVVMTTLGGDYYDCFKINDDNQGIIIGDVAGHGVPAGLMMAMAKSGVLTSSEEIKLDPSVLTTRLHKMFFAIKNERLKRMMTFMYFVLNVKDNVFNYTNAGHCFCIIVDPEKKTSDFVEYIATPLGIGPRCRCKNQQFILEKGQSLILYTDGIVEAYNEKGEQFGYERFKQALLEHYDPDPEKFYYNLYDKVYKVWSPKPDDDLTIIIVNRKKE